MASALKKKRRSIADIDTLVQKLNLRLNALIICISHSWGGLEQVAANDAIELARLGLKVKVLCLEASPIYEHLSHRENIPLLPIIFQPRNFLDLKLRKELKSLIEDQNINLIHTHQTSLLGSIIPWVWGKRHIVVLASRHIMNTHNKKNFFHSAVYRRLDALIVMSQALKRNVMLTHNLKERQLKVIHLGLDIETFNPDRVNADSKRAQWGADPNTVVIGMVGRIDPAKGQDTFIKAAAGLVQRSQSNEKLKFVIVGEETLGRTSTYLEELRRLVHQFHLDGSVVFAGYQEDIPEVVAAFDIFVMPSRQETFGLVALEAMAMECPIIITSGGSADEIVGQEEFGLLTRPGDAFDLRRQISHLLDNPKDRVIMGQRGREHVKLHYDRRVRVLRTLELYERSIRRRGL